MTVLLILLSFPVQDASDWYALLQNRFLHESSADYLISGSSGQVLDDGLPLAGIGSVPADLSWPDAEITDPLQSGIWGGGKWNTSVTHGYLQDTLSLSRIGLIQNTGDHSRYSFELDRPLPWGMAGNFDLTRDDSVSLAMGLLSRGPFSLKGASWESGGHGWGTWGLWNGGPAYLRAGFSRLYEDDRRPELLTGVSSALGGTILELGAAAARVDSSFEYRTAGGISFSPGLFNVSLSGEYREEGPGFWGGVTWDPGQVSLSVFHSTPVEGDPFQGISFRGGNFNLLGRIGDDPAAAADWTLEAWLLRGKAAAAWLFDGDSLAVNCRVLLGRNWYRGRVEAGPRFTGSMNDSGEWTGTVDALLGFTLLPFSIGAAIEDITDDQGRTWSFGITWAFTDGPPAVPEGEEDGR